MLRLLPGELAILLRKTKLAVAFNSPLLGTASLGPGSLTRNVDDILREISPVMTASQIRAHLQALVTPSAFIEIARGLHRQPPSTFFACVGINDHPVFSVISLEPDGSCMILLPSSREDLAIWILRTFREIPAPEITLREFPPMKSAGLIVVMALADLFRSTYPYPDPEWRPREEIGFDVDRLLQILEDGSSGRDSSSLVECWKTLSGVSVPTPNKEEIEGILFVLANEGFLHLELTDDGKANFLMGKAFTWAMRCLAWWDLTLTLMATSLDSIAAIQATGIWRWKPTHPNPDQQVELEVIAGTDFESDVRDFLDRAMGLHDEFPHH